MSGDARDWVVLLVIILLAFIALQVVSTFIQRFLKLDKTEREQVLQTQIDSLLEKQGEDREEIHTLKGHIKLLIGQYDDLLIKYNLLEQQYQVATKEASDLKERVTLLSQQPIRSAASTERILIVCTSMENEKFSLDLASIRAVRTETGLEISTIKELTPEALKKTLDRARAKGNLIYLHLAVRSDKNGYQLGTEIVDATWLSSVLDSVIILVVAGSDSDEIGDFLGVVPYVVTVSGGVNHKDAAVFSRLFWTEIGHGMGPSLALKKAMDRSPSSIRENVVSHWQLG